LFVTTILFCRGRPGTFASRRTTDLRLAVVVVHARRRVTAIAVRAAVPPSPVPLAVVVVVEIRPTRPTAKTAAAPNANALARVRPNVLDQRAAVPHPMIPTAKVEAVDAAVHPSLELLVEVRRPTRLTARIKPSENAVLRTRPNTPNIPSHALPASRLARVVHPASVNDRPENVAETEDTLTGQGLENDVVF
jgi:hypothetical protein